MESPLGYTRLRIINRRELQLDIRFNDSNKRRTLIISLLLYYREEAALD